MKNNIFQDTLPFAQSTYTTVDEEYHKVQSDIGVTYRGLNFLTIIGTEALSFLHRLSTNALEDMQAGQCRPTVFTTEKGKLIDLATVIQSGEGVILVVSSKNASRVKNWLDKFIIMEDITITDVTDVYSMFSFLGPHVDSLREKINLEGEIPAEGFYSHTHINGYDATLFQDQFWNKQVFNLLVKNDAVSEIWNHIIQSVHPVGSASYDTIRIENGITQFGKELTEKINPLEAGLERFINYSKGCYIGQEVIARIDTYNKLQRRLQGFIFPHSNEIVSNGTLFHNGEEVGWTTSHTWSFKLNKQIALGFLKTGIEADNLDFTISGPSDKVNVKPCNLPF